jgi:hypothetical protein
LAFYIMVALFGTGLGTIIGVDDALLAFVQATHSIREAGFARRRRALMSPEQCTSF